MADRYVVVICPECQLAWVVDGRPNRTECRRCGKSHQLSKLRIYHTTDSREEAKLARAKVQAHADGNEDQFERAAENNALQTDWAADLGSGIDLDGSTGGSSQTPREIVLEAVETVDHADEAAVIEYAEARDVDAETARSLLQKCVQAGDLLQTDGEYRSV